MDDEKFQKRIRIWDAAIFVLAPLAVALILLAVLAAYYGV